jgi:signal-transduction protein with cAMP-binding, CBS, and nucleotidyltransferase domain
MRFLDGLLESREVLSAETGDTVFDVARQMSAAHVGAILVFHRGELKGLFSERDLLTRVVAAGRNPKRTRIRDVMTTDLVAIDESATAQQAMELMRHYRCRHLPVLRAGRVLGIVSVRDLMSVQLDSKSGQAAPVRSYIQSVC